MWCMDNGFNFWVCKTHFSSISLAKFFRLCCYCLRYVRFFIAGIYLPKCCLKFFFLALKTSSVLFNVYDFSSIFYSYFVNNYIFTLCIYIYSLTVFSLSNTFFIIIYFHNYIFLFSAWNSCNIIYFKAIEQL